MNQSSNWRGMALALCATLFYGQVPVLAKLAFQHGVDGIATVLARTIFVSAALVPVAWALRAEVPKIAQNVAAFLGLALATLAVSTGIIVSVQFIPASLAVIIFFSAPLIVLLAAPLVEGTALSMKRLAVGLLGFAGLALALGPSLESLDPRGLGLAALAALGYVGQFIFGRKLATEAKPMAMAWAVHVAILPVVAMLFLTWPKASPVPLDNFGILAMAAVCLVYLLGFTLHMTSLSAASASRVVMFFNFEPVITMIFATLLLSEQLSGVQYLGFGVVLAALFLSTV